MPNPIDTVPAVQLATLVTFSWGTTPTRQRYCRWTGTITVSGDVFNPLPRMEVDLGEQTGGVQDEQVKILIDSSVEPIPRLDGQRFSPIEVLIEECDPQNAVATRRTRWKGEVDRAIFNAGGRSGIARVLCRGWRGMLDVSLGLLVDPSCDYTFGDPRSCKVSLADKTFQSSNLTIASISGNVVTMSGSDLSLVTSKPARYFHRGRLVVDGYSIMIRDWESGSTFVMIRPPPREWVGAHPTVIAGCDHTLDGPNGCRFWSNEENFGGIGRKMLNRDPRFEVSQD